MAKVLFLITPMHSEHVAVAKVFPYKLKYLMAYTEEELKKELETKEYEYGFYTDIDSETFPVGLNEEVVRGISQKKNEPEWMTSWRLEAFKAWKAMDEPNWANVKYNKPNYQDISYYSAPKKKDQYKSLDEVDPELLATFKKLGISLDEQKKLAGVAVDIVMDSVSVATTFKGTLAEKGIIFCSISEAIKEHPDLVKKYIGTVIPFKDNFFAALNSAVFSDGSFCYIPKGVRCPMELSTYFRINQAGTGQFERTLVIADESSYVSYLEGCTAPSRDENQLHAAVVELIALDDAEIKYSTVQNWFPGDKNGKGGVYNFVTKRGICHTRSKISWTQVETGSAVTWKYPSCILKGNDSIGEFYSIALTNNYQQADTGTKMIHLGKNTKSTIISKGISAGKSQNSYRGLVQVSPRATNARNFSQCDSLLMGNNCGAHTFPYIEVKNKSAQIEHEATTSKIGEDQVFYCNQRGIDPEKAIALIVNGFSKEVLNKLPMEFAVEAQKLLEISLEGSVG
jgi:Fe-S cluster assembly protein SufB